MDIIIKIITKIFSSINSLINNLNKKTVKIIKQSYIMLIFVLSVLGIIYGYNSGKSTAKIKSAPLSENINDVFQIDINKEKRDGKFGKMLESEMINEMKYTDMNKIQFPSKEMLKPDLEHRIIEPDKDKKISADPRVQPMDKQIEGSYRNLNRINPDVKPLKKSGTPIERKKDDERTERSLIEEDKTPKNKLDEKIKTDGRKIKLEPIKSKTGIIEN